MIVHFAQRLDQLFARVDKSGATYTAYWTLTDNLGSVGDVVDNSGTVQASVSYDGFGNATITGTAVHGILAKNSDVGNVSVTTSVGDVINSGASGITAYNQATSILASLRGYCAFIS